MTLQHFDEKQSPLVYGKLDSLASITNIAILIFFFLAYGLVQSKVIVAILYILDQVFYNFHIAINTYFQKIADPVDIASSISLSLTINHIAAVVLPALGGILWMIDYRIPFVCGAGFSLVSLVAVQEIKNCPC